MKALKASATDPEFYGENVVAWKPGASKQAMARGEQTVTFYNKSVLDRALSKEEGRPRYTKVPYVRITQPGDRDNIINRPAWIDEDGAADMADNVRFAEHWKAFVDSNGEDAGPAGTPLAAVPFLTREQVEEMKHFNITTVEALANMPDGNAQRFMGIRALMRLAKDYLEAAKDGSVITRLHSELDDTKVMVSRQEQALAEQAETIRQLREMVEAQQRGREAAVEARNDEPVPLTPDPDNEKPVEPTAVEKSGGFLRPKTKGK